MMRRLAAPLLCSSFFLLMVPVALIILIQKILNKIQLQKQSRPVLPNKLIRSRQSHILMSLGRSPVCLISAYW